MAVFVRILALLAFYCYAYITASKASQIKVSQHNIKSIEEKLKELIVREFGVDQSRISHRSKVKEFGRDSLAVLELLAAVEAQFEISIPNEEVSKISSFESLVHSIEKHLDMKSGST